METKGLIKERDSRYLCYRHMPRGHLSRHLFCLLHIVLLSPAVALFLVSESCRKNLPPLPDPQPVPSVADSLIETVISPVTNLAGAISHLDLAVYAEEAPRRLEYHARTPFSGEIQALTVPGDKRIVLIANSPYVLNYDALQGFDAMEQLQMCLADEYPDRPLMSGTAVAPAGSRCEVSLLPLRGEIILVCVDNALPRGILLERPRVRLAQVSPRAEVLRTGSFHPTETQDGEFVPLDASIGYFPVLPGIRLPCYPFDASGAGASAARLEFACEIAGTECLYRIRLPSLERGRILCVELAVTGTDSFRAHVYDGGGIVY